MSVRPKSTRDAGAVEESGKRAAPARGKSTASAGGKGTSARTAKIAAAAPGKSTGGVREKNRRVADARPLPAICPDPPVIMASAEEMSKYLEAYGRSLLRLAEQMRRKKPKETLALQWPPCVTILYCNGGGDGGGGGE
jgi:hypothetical protein